ncbi:unnamed protein product [Durusdinium trenchii]|uniref:GH16 domain-containing protein n=1 Tax=Durusdinium trenchii TaxID=1381693 RepID=A0ABP0ILT4_9DINO
MPPPPSVRPTQGLGLWNGLMTLKVTTWTRHLALSQGGYRGIDLPVAGLNITACRSAMCRAENVRVDGGLLRLQSDRDPSDSSRYFSAAVTTKDRVSWSAQPAPFRLCVRAKLLLNTKGVWPAHWMLPENGYSDQCLDEGEMDITEMVSGDGTVYNTYHWMSSWPQQRCAKFDTYHKSAASSRRIRSYSSDFHEYAVERSMDHISYAVDGKVVGRFSSEEHGFQISSSPFFLILNTAIGGAWPGSPQPDETRMPVFETMITRLLHLSIFDDSEQLLRRPNREGGASHRLDPCGPRHESDQRSKRCIGGCRAGLSGQPGDPDTSRMRPCGCRMSHEVLDTEAEWAKRELRDAARHRPFEG